MLPGSETITQLEAPRGNSLVASVDVPPQWQPSSFARVPFFGTLFSIFGNAMRYNTKLEDCADFLAADLASSDRSYVGHRVGVINSGKGKVE